MSGYAAAMDASMSGSPECTKQEAETLSELGVLDATEPCEGPSEVDWESQTGEESDKASVSLCVESKKGKGATSHTLFALYIYSYNITVCCIFSIRL